MRGLFISANAGHNFPFLVRERAAVEIAGGSAVLGVKSRKPFKEQSHVLDKGDAIVLYTDGLVEALDQTGEQIGYDRFGEILPGLMRTGSPATEAAIRRQFQLLAAPGPLADDVTIVVLQRSEAS